MKHYQERIDALKKSFDIFNATLPEQFKNSEWMDIALGFNDFMRALKEKDENLAEVYNRMNNIRSEIGDLMDEEFDNY